MNRKGGRNGHAPPALLWAPFYYPGGPNSSRVFGTPFLMPDLLSPAAPGRIPPRRNRDPRPSRFCGTRKRSVPVRVHSVLRVLAWPGPVARPPASNPFLTHGTVESPAKLHGSNRSSGCPQGAPPPPISSPGSSQPLSLAGGGTPKLTFSQWPAAVRRRAGDRIPLPPSSRARPPWPACTPAPWSR